MNEAFLSFIWKFKMYQEPLYTDSGTRISVLSPGEQQHNAGPDFFNARIRIGDTLWAGNVEIHERASDWYRHNHQVNAGYDGVILHVVYDADCEIMLSDLRVLPTLTLRHYIHDNVSATYAHFLSSRHEIPCGANLRSVRQITISQWFDRMAAEKLEQKSDFVQEAINFCWKDFESAFYQVLSNGFGFHVNALPFTMLARSLPLKILKKHGDDLALCEALIFGQAGLLQPSEEMHDDQYKKSLFNNYQFLSAKYSLLPMETHHWKFLRMRPVNFPTIRLAQFARLIASNPLLFNDMLLADNLESLSEIFQISASEYWDTHYLFNKTSPYKSKSLGKDAISLLLINAVIPFLFTYGKLTGNRTQCDKALRLLEEIGAEHNKVISTWEQAGVSFRSALQTQAALHCYQHYCLPRKCLNCSIGIAILGKD